MLDDVGHTTSAAPMQEALINATDRFAA
jgi:hypothetical protein